MLAIAGAVLALVVVALVVRRGPAAPEHTTAAPTDTAPVSARPVTADHTARPKAEGVSPAAARGVPGPAPVSAPSPMTGAGLRRYAQTWVNVRGDRTRSAPTVGMLNPGDAVTVDSLVHGWYRVLVDGRALGYVHRSTLDVSRPE